jgi:ApbE superfamily uncharacterized protein (UPF0280 family)
MRKALRAFVGTAVSLCLVGALAMAAAPAGSKSAPITVGKFAMELARVMNVKVQGALTADSAKKALAGLGINMGPANAELTDGELVRVLGQLGINTRTSDPGRSVSVSKAESVFRIFRSELTKAGAGATGVVAAGNGGDDFNNGNGKGGKFKRKANLSPGVPPGQTD